MRYVQIAARYAFGMLLVLHGFAHSPGVLGSWKIAEFEDVSYAPNLLLEQAGDGAIRLLGGVFLLGGLAFVIAGLGVMRRATWWLPTALGATLVSLVVTTLWYQDALVGLVLNLVILVVLGAALVRQIWAAEQHTTGVA
jgi:hypothetical protein